MQLHSPIEESGTDAVSNFRLLGLNNIWAPRARHVCISKKSISFNLCRPKTHFRRQQEHQRASAITDYIKFFQNNYYSKRSRISKGS